MIINTQKNCRTIVKGVCKGVKNLCLTARINERINEKNEIRKLQKQNQFLTIMSYISSGFTFTSGKQQLKNLYIMFSAFCKKRMFIALIYVFHMF